MSDPFIVFRQNNKLRDAIISPSITLLNRVRIGQAMKTKKRVVLIIPSLN